MRFLVDECTGPRVAEWLRSEGHDVLSVYDEMRGADDSSILAKAFTDNWIVITNDKDFGEQVFREQHPHRGVVFLRLQDQRFPAKIDALRILLEKYADQLPDSFVVVTEKQVRFSQTPK